MRQIRSREWAGGLPAWVPQEVRLYLDHTESGVSLRALARREGVHASTVLRQIRKTESRRDDPLVDRMLTRLGRSGHPQSDPAPDDATFKRDASRILRALAAPGAILAIAAEVTTAVVVQESEEGQPRQIASAEREIVEALALRGWIELRGQGRVARYHIAAEGRAALNRLLAESESAKLGFGEAPAAFRGPRAAEHMAPRDTPSRRAAGAEHPLQVLARRRDKSGQPYLEPDHLRAAARLRHDFELAALGHQIATNWQNIMKGGPIDGRGAGGGHLRSLEARRRLDRALRALGPELGETALITCCQERGMEQAEAELNMPARAGKYVLRIALNMLIRHYEAERGVEEDLIY